MCSAMNGRFTMLFATRKATTPRSFSSLSIAGIISGNLANA